MLTAIGLLPRSAIESLGFTKGVQIEVIKNLKKDRGFVTRVDKRGKIHIELHNDVINEQAITALDGLLITTIAYKFSI